MQKMIPLLLCMLSVASWADDVELMNQAARTAVDLAAESLNAQRVQKPALQSVKRIGIAQLDNDTQGITNLVKVMGTRTDYNIVLIEDDDWQELVDEFARQAKRGDIINPETAEKLRVQGVDAILFGDVERADVRTVEGDGGSGAEATVRIMLNLASLDESNPGSLLWADQLTGRANDVAEASLDQNLMRAWGANPIVLTLGIVALFLVAGYFTFNRLTTPR